MLLEVGIRLDGSLEDLPNRTNTTRLPTILPYKGIETNCSHGERIHMDKEVCSFLSLFFLSTFLFSSREIETIVSISLIPLYKLYMHSCNACESLGHGDLSPYNEPKLIDRFRDYSVLTMSCGMNHAACVTDDGRPWTWGSNDYMQVRTHTHSPERFVPFHHHYILHEIEYRIE